MRMEMVVAMQPPGASQEPRECQHRQCFQWIQLLDMAHRAGSINCPKPGKVNESGPGDMQEDQEENKSTRDKA